MIMIPCVNICLWSFFFGILAFFTYHELQETSRDFTERQLIPGDREKVFKVLLEPETMSKFHPIGAGTTDIHKTYDDDDPEEITEIRYTAREKLSVLGYFERVLSIRFTLVVVEPNAVIDYYADAEDIFHMRGSFALSDYRGKDRQGTALVEKVTITSHRALVNFALAETVLAHRTSLKNLRKYFLEQNHQ